MKIKLSTPFFQIGCEGLPGEILFPKPGFESVALCAVLQFFVCFFFFFHPLILENYEE